MLCAYCRDRTSCIFFSHYWDVKSQTWSISSPLNGTQKHDIQSCACQTDLLYMMFQPQKPGGRLWSIASRKTPRHFTLPHKTSLCSLVFFTTFHGLFPIIRQRCFQVSILSKINDRRQNVVVLLLLLLFDELKIRVSTGNKIMIERARVLTRW